MIQPAKTIALAAGGGSFLIAAAGGGSPEIIPAAAGMLALGGAAKLFGVGTEGLSKSLRPWLPLVSGLALGGLLAGSAAWSAVVVSLIPLAGLIAAWPDRRTPRRTMLLALGGGYVGFFAAALRVNPHDAVLAAFWAAAAYPVFPKMSLGLWGGAMFAWIRAGEASIPEETFAWVSNLSIAVLPAFVISAFAFYRHWARAGSWASALLWLGPAVALGGWPAAAFFPLAASFATRVDASENAKLPSRPLWVLPSAWNPELTAPRFALGPGRVLACMIMTLVGAWGLFTGVAGRGALAVRPLDALSDAELFAGLRFKPLDSKINIRLAEMALEDDAFSRAGDILDRVRGQRPRRASWWRVQGQLRFRSGDLPGGLVHAARGLVEDEGDPKAYEALGNILSGVDPSLAAMILARGLQSCPGEPGLLKGLASVYEGMGKARAALPLYMASLALEGRDVESLRGICRTSYVRGREAETRLYLNKLRQLTPNDPWVHRYLQRLDQP